MTCNKDTKLDQVAKSFRHLAQNICGERHASNRILNLHLQWGLMGPIFVFKLEETPNIPERYFDITLELQKLYFDLNLWKF